MQSQPNGATRERVDFSKIKASIPIPNLIEVQKKSYERFLQMELLPDEREFQVFPDAHTIIKCAVLERKPDFQP